MANLINAGSQASHRANYAGVTRGTAVRRDSGSNDTESEDEQFYLDIYLRKHNDAVDMKLTPDELERLVFRSLKIPRDTVTAISQGDLRFVEVRMTTDPSPWQNLSPIWIKDGLTTSGVFQDRERVAWITLQGAPLKVSNKAISDVFAPFGKRTSKISKIINEARQGFPENLVGLWSGGRRFAMKMEHDLPSFAYIEGRKCRLFYQGMVRRCNHCGEQENQCPGRANYQACAENGGERAKLMEVWTELRNNAEEKMKEKEANYLGAANRHLVDLLNHHEELTGTPRVQAGFIPEEEDVIPPAPEGRKKGKQPKNVAARALQSENVEIFRVPPDMEPELVLKAALDALKMDRINAPDHWRLYKIKERCWMISGLSLAEREVLLSAKLKIGRSALPTRPQIIPVEEHIFEDQSGELPPMVRAPREETETETATETPPETAPETVNAEVAGVEEEGNEQPSYGPATLSKASTADLPARERVKVAFTAKQWANPQEKTPEQLTNTPMASTARGAVQLPDINISPLGDLQEEEEDENSINREYITQKSRGYKKRFRSGNSSKNSQTTAKPSPKKMNLNISSMFTASPNDLILEEAARLSQTQYMGDIQLDGDSDDGSLINLENSRLGNHSLLEDSVHLSQEPEPQSRVSADAEAGQAAAHVNEQLTGDNITAVGGDDTQEEINTAMEEVVMETETEPEASKRTALDNKQIHGKKVSAQVESHRVSNNSGPKVKNKSKRSLNAELGAAAR